ncbi:hypothetical protein [Pedobacter sp. SYP-B3415]|uniref:hypothetical protein n=1 Tax=Pedobacter sp. SYP-B3415 TaxID=2496641 RepID=UPI00101D4F04|nr:hypothetical protein [Pedobacter sp. SYP-B3415]
MERSLSGDDVPFENMIEKMFLANQVEKKDSHLAKGLGREDILMSSDFIRDLMSLAILREKVQEHEEPEKLTKPTKWSI